MSKVDLKKELKAYYSGSPRVVARLRIPSLNYLMIDGEGDPGDSPRFSLALETLYPVAYGIKFLCKQAEQLSDFVVMPLEGLWWAEDYTAFIQKRRNEWKWTLMIMQPDFVTSEIVNTVVESARKKGKGPLLDEVRFESYEEGEVVQLLHLGPYEREEANVQRLHDEIEELGKELHLKHHEIYLSDPRRCAPEKLKTLLRQPYCAPGKGK